MRIPTPLNYIKYRSPLYESAFKSDGRQHSPSLNSLPQPDKTADPVELSREISDAVVKCLSCIKIWWLRWLARGCCDGWRGILTKRSAVDDKQKRRGAMQWTPCFSLNLGFSRETGNSHNTFSGWAGLFDKLRASADRVHAFFFRVTGLTSSLWKSLRLMH